VGRGGAAHVPYCCTPILESVALSFVDWDLDIELAALHLLNSSWKSSIMIDITI